jgi:hypothetical protein
MLVVFVVGLVVFSMGQVSQKSKPLPRTWDNWDENKWWENLPAPPFER